MLLIYKLGSIKNRNMDVTNLEIGYYQNKKEGVMIYISTILDSYCGSYKIEEELDGIYNDVLNIDLLL